MVKTAFVPLFALLFVAPLDGRAKSPAPNDWPQWLGVNRDGISKEKNLVGAVKDGALKTLWTRTMGGGFSAVSIVQGKAYTMESDDTHDFVLCLDAKTGKLLWRTKIGKRFDDHQGGHGPRGTPVLSNGRVIALTGHGMLVSLNANDGSVHWSEDLVAKHKGEAPQWGYSASPLVWNGLVFVDVGGTSFGDGLMAFHEKTGALAWANDMVKAGYSSPLHIEVDGIHQVLFFTGRELVSVDPVNGNYFFRVPWQTSWDVNSATPVFIPPNRFFISSGYGTGGAVYEMTKKGSDVEISRKWRNKNLKNKMATSVYYNGHLYGTSNDDLVCVDAKTGKKKWSQDGFGLGTLLIADGKIFALTDTGTLVIAKASPAKYQELGRQKVLEEKCWTMPSLSNGRLFLRDEHKLVVLDVQKR